MKLFTNEYPWRSIISIYAPWHEKITIQLLSLICTMLSNYFQNVSHIPKRKFKQCALFEIKVRQNEMFKISIIYIFTYMRCINIWICVYHDVVWMTLYRLKIAHIPLYVYFVPCNECITRGNNRASCWIYLYCRPKWVRVATLLLRSPIASFSHFPQKIILVATRNRSSIFVIRFFNTTYFNTNYH